MAERSESAPKLFHSFVRKKGCSSVGPLKPNRERAMPNTSEMSKLLADAFSAVFVDVAAHISAQH